MIAEEKRVEADARHATLVANWHSAIRDELPRRALVRRWRAGGLASAYELEARLLRERAERLRESRLSMLLGPSR